MNVSQHVFFFLFSAPQVPYSDWLEREQMLLFVEACT